jgi:hypothetical protein
MVSLRFAVGTYFSGHQVPKRSESLPLLGGHERLAASFKPAFDCNSGFQMFVNSIPGFKLI